MPNYSVGSADAPEQIRMSRNTRVPIATTILSWAELMQGPSSREQETHRNLFFSSLSLFYIIFLQRIMEL